MSSRATLSVYSNVQPLSSRSCGMLWLGCSFFPVYLQGVTLYAFPGFQVGFACSLFLDLLVQTFSAD